MKTKVIIQVKTMDVKDCKVLPEEGKSEDDFTEEELKICRKDYCEDLHKEVVKIVQRYGIHDWENEILEHLEEMYVEGWDDYTDYGIDITVSKETDDIDLSEGAVVGAA